MRRMKDSGIAWLGEVPEEWGVVKGKHLYTKIRRPVRDTDEIITCFRDGTVTLRKNRRTTGFTESLKEIGYQGIRKGDLVIHVMDAFAGSIGVSDSDGKGSPVYSVCQAKLDINNKYYAYVLREMARSGYIKSLRKGIRERSSEFRFSIFAAQRYPLPPREEQDAIARYLDEKTAKIDRLLDARRKEVAALKELKRALINERISEKAYADTFKKLKHIALCNQSTLSEKTPPDYKFRYVDIASFDSAKGITQYQEMTFGNSPSRARRMVRNGDIIISTVRTYLRAIAKIEDDKDVIVSTGFAVIAPKDANSKYLEYCFKSDLFCDEVIRRSAGVAYPAINTKALMNIAIPLPPREEQDAIARYLDEKTSRIDRIAAAYTKEVALLEELKAAVIAEGVRGRLALS